MHVSEVSLTFKAWTANFVQGVIRSLIQQQIFLQSMASIHLDKYGIFAQLRKKQIFHAGVIALQMLPTLSPKACIKSSKDAWSLSYFWFSTSEKYRIICLFVMMKSHFRHLSFQDVAKVIENSCWFFFLDTDFQNNGCSLYMSFMLVTWCIFSCYSVVG